MTRDAERTHLHVCAGDVQFREAFAGRWSPRGNRQRGSDKPRSTTLDSRLRSIRRDANRGFPVADRKKREHKYTPFRTRPETRGARVIRAIFGHARPLEILRRPQKSRTRDAHDAIAS